MSLDTYRHLARDYVVQGKHEIIAKFSKEESSNLFG
jgi:hypothetical protein